MIYGDDRNDIVISYKHQENIRDEINDTIKFSNFILCNNVKLVSEKEIDTYINENYSVEKKLGTIKHSEQDEYICGSNRFNIYNINLVPNYNVICQSNNRYVYCNSNSIKYVDENGMFWGAAIIKIVDVIGGAILQYFVEGILIMEVYAPGYDD